MSDCNKPPLEDLPLEVKIFLEINKHPNIASYRDFSISNRENEVDALLARVFHGIRINNPTPKLSALDYDYISSIVKEEFSRKHNIVTVDLYVTPQKLVLGYSGDSGRFNYKEVKQRYEQKTYRCNVCELSEFIHVDTKKDRVYSGKKI